jgi:hypothetical protein
VVRHIIGETAFTPSATVYLALCIASPTDAATINSGVYNGSSVVEVPSANGYVRQAITFGAAANRTITQSGDIVFPQATPAGYSASAITHWAIVTSATYGSGNVLAHGEFNPSKVIALNNIPTIASGSVAISITASTGLSNYAAHGILNRMFRNQTFTVSSNYLGISNGAMTDSTTGTTVSEPAGNNYSRVQVGVTGKLWTTVGSTGSTATNSGSGWVMPAPSGSWGTIQNAFIADAATLGNILIYGGITNQSVSTGDTVAFANGQFSFSQS